MIHGIPIERYDELDSTSLHARRLVAAGEIDGPRVIVAATQTGGVGRFGRPWSSPRGGLWCTLIWPVKSDIESMLNGLGLRLGLACLRTIDETFAHEDAGALVQLKWPNDVYVNGRKALGLLTEVVRHNEHAMVLVGVGVNVNFPRSDLPEEFQSNATTLIDVMGITLNIELILASLMTNAQHALNSNGIHAREIDELRTRLFGVGERATIQLANGEARTGAFRGLNPEGRAELVVNGEVWWAPLGAELIQIQDVD